ncbi:MAG: histidine phosphatase family protein, partial [Rhodospirillaceae bacterium]
GIAAGEAMSRYISKNGITIDRVYCSAAQRTRQTYALIKEPLGKAKVTFRSNLYLIDAGDLIGFISKIPDKFESAMIVGHNPGIHMAALRLAAAAADGHDEALAAMTRKFPTGALCTLEFNVTHWQNAARESGTLTAFVRPRFLD